MYGSVICKKLAVLEIENELLNVQSIVTSNYVNSTIQNHISNLASSNYVEDITHPIQLQLNTYNNAFSANATTVTTCNLIVNGTLSLQGGVGFLGTSVLLTASNIIRGHNDPILFTTLTTTSNISFPYASLDQNKYTITFNNAGIYTIGCIRCSSTESVNNRTYYIQRYASDNTTLIDVTQDLIAVSSVNIAINAGNKVRILQAYNHASVNWVNNGDPSYFTIIPLKSEFP